MLVLAYIVRKHMFNRAITYNLTDINEKVWHQKVV